MDLIKCDLCNKNYKYGYYEKHLTSKKHLFNVYNYDHKQREQEEQREQEQHIYTVEKSENINKSDVIETITYFYENFNNRLEYPDGEKLKKVKIESIKKFINNLMRDERTYKH
jgi:hypothetical protein